MALPVTFVAGDVLEAAQLNSNFTYLEGAGGLTLITKVAFTSQTTVAFANDIFTSTYTRYLVQMSAESTSGDSVVTMQVRDNSGTKSAAGYNGAVLGLGANGVANNVATSSGTTFSMGQAGQDYQGFWSLHVTGPTSTTHYTTWAGSAFLRLASAGAFQVAATVAGTYNVNEAHTGLVFNFSVAATGVYNVYGLAD